jgi:23S rRNA pseudouridine1911/1915/1917 synthase
MNTFRTTEKEQGYRIDQVVLNILPSITRSTSKKLLMDGLIKVNQEQVRPNYKVKVGDEVSYDENIIKQFTESDDRSNIKPVQMELEVIYEDDSTIVVNKPFGLTTHPVPGHREDTLLNGLVWYQQNNTHSQGKIRPVHRLDKDTSGVILFAKSKDAHQFYSRQFEQGKVEKTYIAAVKGDFKKYLGSRGFITLQNYIERSTKDRKKMIAVPSDRGQVAITNFFFEDYWYGLKNAIYSLVKCSPRTGRTHQIRVHLSGLGFPIVGDSFYSQIQHTRLMLHSYSLKLDVFEKGVMEFIAELPNEFKSQ